MADDPITGIVAIIHAPDGSPVAWAADFAAGEDEGREYRAKLRLKDNLVRAYCPPTFADAMDGYAREVIWRRLIESGHKLTIIPVGHE